MGTYTNDRRSAHAAAIILSIVLGSTPLTMGQSAATGGLAGMVEDPSGAKESQLYTSVHHDRVMAIEAVAAQDCQPYAAKRVVAGKACVLEGNFSTADSALGDAQAMHCRGSIGAGDAASRVSNVERIAKRTVSL
jgi:hypothetical protein